ncbi:MAG: hypothetical protein WC807_18570 [Hyphomicrobium sp.]|jgi:hypothetical protein
MTQTTRLTVVEQDSHRSILDRFTRKKPASPPDFVLIEQLKIRAADTCVEHIRATFQALDDQLDVWELMGKVFKNAEIQARAFRHAEDEG